jgi:hypothetical protein
LLVHCQNCLLNNVRLFRESQSKVHPFGSPVGGL